MLTWLDADGGQADAFIIAAQQVERKVACEFIDGLIFFADHAILKIMSPLESLTPVPLTLEGSSMLHQMLRVRWPEWRALPAVRRDEILNAGTAAIQQMENQGSAMFSLLGHKGDLMLVHFRQNFDQLGEVERALQKLALWDFVEQTSSYLSIVELGLYESTAKVYGGLAERGIEPHTPEWDGNSRDARPPAPGHASAIVSGDAGAQVHLLLSDGPAARRRQELVSASFWGKTATDGRPWHHRPALRGSCEADHFRLHRF